MRPVNSEESAVMHEVGAALLRETERLLDQFPNTRSSPESHTVNLSSGLFEAAVGALCDQQHSTSLVFYGLGVTLGRVVAQFTPEQRVEVCNAILAGQLDGQKHVTSFFAGAGHA